MAGESFVTWTLTAVTTPTQVRQVSGYASERDVSDADLLVIIARAQADALQDLSSRVNDVPLWGTIDGVNTRFELPPRLAHRVILDADGSGNEASDLQVYLKSQPSGSTPVAYALASVASVDALHGQVVLSAAPSPLTVHSVRFSGLLVGYAVTQNVYKEAVEWLASHFVDQKVRQPGNVPLSNPNAAQKDEKNPGGRFLDQYLRIIQKARPTVPQAASVRTRMRDSWWDDVRHHTPP